jgi:uncharacterized membrane protein SirB2
MSDDVYDFPEVEVQSIRSEMKDWLTRNLLTTAAVAPIGTAAIAMVENLGKDRQDESFGVAVAALLCLLAIANLSGYCAFARAKAVAYLKQYHPHFLTRSAIRVDEKADKIWGDKQCGDVPSNEAELVLAVFHCSFALFLALTIIGDVPGFWKYTLLLFCTPFVGATNYWQCRSAKIAWRSDVPACDMNWAGAVYKDAEVKALREDIRDWQTRRFTLLTAAFAVVGFVIASCEKLLKNAANAARVGNLCNLALLTLVTLFTLTWLGNRANGAASYYLRSRYPGFQWEARIYAWNKERDNRNARLKQNLALVYLLLGALVLFYGRMRSPDCRACCIMLLPAMLLGAVLFGAAKSRYLDGSRGWTKQ